MSEAKNHHYIPQSYLRKFAYQKGKEYYVYVRYNGEKFYETNVRNICSENYFYSIPNDDNKNRIEEYYADEIDTVFPILHEVGRNEGIKKLDSKSIQKIVRASLSLYLRTPKFLKQYNEHLLSLLAILKNYSLGKSELHYANFFGKKIDIKNVDYEKLENTIINENKITFLSEHLAILDSWVAFKSADGIGINTIVDDSEFITSDNPVLIRNNKTGVRNHLFDPNCIIYLPIDRKMMLTILPNNFGSIDNNVLRVLSTKDFTISINHSVESDSDMWIIGSQNSLKNHLADQAKYNELTPENYAWLADNIRKAELMSELSYILTKNNDTINAEVAEKVKELSQHELLKGDPQLMKVLRELDELGY